jgi:phosphoglycerate dehydrogenase-like enzyme
MDSIIEIIDDSEPEREAWRMTLQEKRRQRRAAAADTLASEPLNTKSPINELPGYSLAAETSHCSAAQDNNNLGAFIIESNQHISEAW